jgi:energy-coupling factor transport system permease protein
MAATLVLMALPFAAPGLWSGMLLALFVIVVAFLSSAPFSALLRTLRTVFWLGFFMFFFYFFTTPGHTLVSVRGINVTVEGLVRGATQIYRLFFLVLVSSLLTFTTSPAQLTQGLEAMFGPLAHIDLPVRELSVVLTIALRFVPTVFDQIDKITKAQRARGADPRTGNPWRRMKSWVPTFVPIFIAAFRRADELATAMEARGFRGARKRTHLHQLRLNRGDLIAALTVLGVSAVVLACHRLL